MSHPTLQEGTRLQASHKGKTYECKAIEVTPKGRNIFEYEGKRYGSLSAAGKVVTGHATNGWIFWHIVEGGPVSGTFMGPDEYASAAKPTVRRSRREPPREHVEFDYSQIEVDTLPDEFKVRDGYVPMKPDAKGGYPTANPKLDGAKPDWFDGDTNLWVGQCTGCQLLVINSLRVKGQSFDDWDAEVPHACTRRFPGESAEQAQDRLRRGYGIMQQQKKRIADLAAHEEARRNAKPLYEGIRKPRNVVRDDEVSEAEEPLEDED